MWYLVFLLELLKKKALNLLLNVIITNWSFQISNPDEVVAAFTGKNFHTSYIYILNLSLQYSQETGIILIWGWKQAK